MTTPKKISELPPLATLQSADIFPVVDGGVTKKVTAQAIATFIGTYTDTLDGGGA